MANRNRVYELASQRNIGTDLEINDSTSTSCPVKKEGVSLTMKPMQVEYRIYYIGVELGVVCACGATVKWTGQTVNGRD